MNGVFTVQQRIVAIEARFSPSRPAAPPETSSGPDEDFGSIIEQLTDTERSMRSFGVPGSTRQVSRASGSYGDPPNLSPALHDAFESAAERYGLDVDLLMAVAWQESGFNPGAVSHAGAIGLMQLMPGTAAGLGVDPMNPIQNIDGGARYLRQQIDRFGSVELGLAAYNAGPGAVQRHGGIPPFAETQAYVPAVIARWGAVARGSAPTPTSLPSVDPPAPSAAVATVGAETSVVPTEAAVEPVGTPVMGAVAGDQSSTFSGEEVVSVEAPEVSPAAEADPLTDASAEATGDAVETVDEMPAPTADAGTETDGEGAPTNAFQSAASSSTDGSEQADVDSFVPITSTTSGSERTTRVETPTAAAPPMSTQEVPAEIVRLARQDGGVVRMQLSPNGLGEVQIQVSLAASGEVVIDITADSEQTAVLLGRLRDTIEAALRTDGVGVDSFEVSTTEDTPDTSDDTSANTETDSSPRDANGDGPTTADAAAGAVIGSVIDDETSSDDPSVLRI